MLNRNSIVAIAAISTLATVALAPTSASAMRGGFDGDWSVVIMTQLGACSTGVRFGVDIRNGVKIAGGTKCLYQRDPIAGLPALTNNRGG